MCTDLPGLDVNVFLSPIRHHRCKKSFLSVMIRDVHRKSFHITASHSCVLFHV
jgi:hypothetical protein